VDSVCGQSVQLCGADIRSKDDFEAFVKQHMKTAYLTALGLVGNREDALELSQEAFFRAYQHYDQLQAQGKFFAWFYQILRNLCFSHLRKRRLRQATELPQAEGCEPTAAGDDGFRPDAIAEHDERRDAVWRALGRLSETHREIIILRHFENLSYEKIAQTLMCNPGTMMSRLYHARKRLKEILEQEKGGLWS